MPKLKDFLTAENDLDGQEYAYISQASKTRKTTYQKIKEWILGTTALTTIDKTITGAIQELKGKVDANTSSLSDVAHKTATLQTNLNADLLDGQHGSYYAPLASPNFTGAPQIAGKSIATTESTDLSINLLNGWTSVGASYTYCRKNNKLIILNMLITNTAATNQSDYIAQVDASVKPPYIVSIGVVNKATGAIMPGFINQSGYIYPITGGLSANTQYFISVCYIL